MWDTPTLEDGDVRDMPSLRSKLRTFTHYVLRCEKLDPPPRPTLSDLAHGELRAQDEVVKDHACLWRSTATILAHAARRHAFEQGDLSQEELDALNSLAKLFTSCDVFDKTDPHAFGVKEALKKFLGSIKRVSLAYALRACNSDGFREAIEHQQTLSAFSSDWPEVAMVHDLLEHLGMGVIVAIRHASAPVWEYRKISKRGSMFAMLHHADGHFGFPALLSCAQCARVRCCQTARAICCGESHARLSV